MSLENLKDLEEGLKEVPKKVVNFPEPTNVVEKTIIKKTETDEIYNKEVEKLLDELKKWKIAFKVNHDMQRSHRAVIQEYKWMREEYKFEKNELRAKAAEAKNERDKINKIVNELKKQRQGANQKIKEYKSKRDEKWSEVKRIREHFKNFLNQKQELKDKIYKAQKITKIIESLDWELQTTSMSWEKECELMEQIENFIHQLEKIEELKQFRNITSLIERSVNQIDSLKTDANQFHQLMLDFVEESNFIHNQILENVKQSEIYHKIMIENYEKANKLQIQEDEAHNMMIDAVQEINMLKKGEQEIEKELQAVKRKLGKLREKENVVKKKEEKKIFDQKAKKALEKYKSGKKLTFNELRILMDANMLND